ncbi:MAG: hypothetical protein M3R00_02085 [Pseudomonadota bacterium]|nr:hypothetical protein [Pseudomonadota bacterium]
MISEFSQWVSGQFFALDPELRDEFAQLPDKIMQVEFVGFWVSIYLRPTPDGIVFARTVEGAPDAIIRGTPLALMKMGIVQRFGGDARSADIEIQGDAEFVHQMNILMKKFRIDWDEILANIVGDRVAQPVSSWARASVREAGRVAQAMQENLTEYIQEEIQLLPPREAVDDFMADVDAMRDRVERLEALIRLMHEESAE